MPARSEHRVVVGRWKRLPPTQRERCGRWMFHCDWVVLPLTMISCFCCVWLRLVSQHASNTTRQCTGHQHSVKSSVRSSIADPYVAIAFVSGTDRPVAGEYGLMPVFGFIFIHSSTMIWRFKA